MPTIREYSTPADTRFAPDPAAIPQVSVVLGSLSHYEALLGSGTEVAQ